MEAKTAKQLIREATVGAKKRFSSEIVEFNGVKIEVRQLSLIDRRDYMTRSIDRKTNQADMLKLQVYSVIASCYVPGTDEKVFDETDYNGISSSITGGYADILWEAIQRLSNIEVSDAKKN
jgi:hypothetical protein